MKIGGKVLEGLNIEYVVIPKGGEEYVFKMRGVDNLQDFEEICAKPLPPAVLTPRGTQLDSKDSEFVSELAKWQELRTHWIVIESLKATESLTWDSVTTEPSTLPNWETEMGEAGFSTVEIQSIIVAVFKSCGLSQTHVEKATKDFLVTLRTKVNK